MRGGQRIGDLDRIAQRLVDGQWASSEASRQGFALEVLHHQEIDAVVAARRRRWGKCEDCSGWRGRGLALEALPHAGSATNDADTTLTATVRSRRVSRL